MTPEHEKDLDWITKDYESHAYWSGLGKELFLVSNGDSELTRHRVADVLRRSICSQPAGPVKINRWNDDFSEIITVEVESPGITVSSQLYVDWIQIADYVLLASAASFERLEEENQRRKEAFDRAKRGYEARQLVRQVAEFLEQNPGASVDNVVAAPRESNLEVKQTHIALAKKLIAAKANGVQPQEEVAPCEPAMLNRYECVYS